MAKKLYSEKYLERKLRGGIKELGSLALKFQSSSYTGLPDRLILLPGERVIWVELKSTGEEPSDEQRKRAAMLRRMGHVVYLVDDMEGLTRVLGIAEKMIEGSRGKRN